MHLLLALHNHQPVGNLPAVFVRAYDACYEPVLAALERHPGVRLAVHHSGSLLDWLESERPGYLERLLALRERGQVEILGGGYYEPVLPAVPPEDAQGQIELMARFWEERSGERPRGMWLSERIWDPSLPALVAGTGIRYTFVDDTHLRYAGLRGEVFGGYYLTERAGHGLALLPIDMGLRYLIPFSPAEEVVEHLAGLAAKGIEAVTYGDDGEKFGRWPGTHEWVFGRGWLEAFFAALERAAPAVVTTLPGDYVATAAPAGRCYLPTAAYEEMLEWALPTESQREYRELGLRLRAAGLDEAARPFVRGGVWENFLVKYPEANQLHKRMLRVSAGLRSVAGREGERARGKIEAARRALYRGQCNCAYWHGLFGGLYLGHLRDAAYSNLLAAAHLLDEIAPPPEGMQAEVVDHDLDGHQEAVLENQALAVFITPARGGALVELDDKLRAVNPLAVLARREEAYHAGAGAGSNENKSGSPDGRPRSIHEGEKALPADLARALVYDRGPRQSFLDHFWGPRTTFASLVRGEAEELVTPWRPYSIERVECAADGAVAELLWEGEAGGMPLRLYKCYRLARDSAVLTVDYRLECTGGAGTAEVWLAVETNFTLLGSTPPDYRYELSGPCGPINLPDPGLASAGAAEQVCEVEARDLLRGLGLRLRASEPLGCWRFPVETVSRSERGFELTYQGSALIFHHRRRLEPHRALRLSFQIELEGCSR